MVVPTAARVMLCTCPVDAAMPGKGKRKKSLMEELAELNTPMPQKVLDARIALVCVRRKCALCEERGIFCVWMLGLLACPWRCGRV